jgi:hypothetical protein
VRTTDSRQYQDTHIDVKIVLCAMWIALLFVFAYVDIFGFYRADVLGAALDGEVANTSLTVNQTFLTFTLVYVSIPTLMVVLSLLLKPQVNRVTNILVSLIYLSTVIASCLGEEWAYYIVGSVIEGIVLVAIARSAWKWPPPHPASAFRNTD